MEIPSLIINSPLFDFEGKGNKFKSFVFFLLLLSVLSIPLSAELQITKTTRLQFPLELLVPLCALFITAGIIFKRIAFKFSFPDFAVLVFVGVAMISALFSVIPVHSLKAFIVLTAYAATFYFGFRFLNLNSEQWQIVWRIFMIAYALLMLYTLFRYFNLGIHRQHSYEMSLPFIPGHTLLVAIGFPAFLVAFDQLLRRTYLMFNLTFVLLFLFVAGISYSRIYWVILFLFVFVLIYYRFKKIRVAMLLTAVVLIAAGSVAYHQIDTKRDRERAWDDADDHNSLFVQIQSIFVWHKNESNIERSNRWKVARKIFKAHPVTGSGLNTYPEVYFWYKDYSGIQETNLSCVKMNAHQIYLGWLAEMGILGLVSGIILFLTFLFLAIQLRGSPHFIFALLLFLNFVLLGVIEDYTTLEKIMSVFWISIAYLLHLKSERKA